MKIQILVDNKNSWYVPFAFILKEKLKEKVDFVSVIFEHSKVEKGDILCLIGCEKIFDKLELNKSNIVVHESFLPKGKGWSPLSWQILEGKNEIPVTLFEAEKEIDSGVIYFQEYLKFSGDELLTEIKQKQGFLTNKLIEKYVLCYPNVKGLKQKGKSTFYSKRTPSDSELDINKNINQQFNLLRIVDNDNYPAFFVKNNTKYILKIEKDNG